MMALTDKDALKEQMLSYYGCGNSMTAKGNYRGQMLMYHEAVEIITYCIDNAPVIDAKPVVHGEWIKIIGGFFEMGRCSVCGGQWPTAGGLNFCPTCGADMRGVKDD